MIFVLPLFVTLFSANDSDDNGPGQCSVQRPGAWRKVSRVDQQRSAHLGKSAPEAAMQSLYFAMNAFVSAPSQARAMLWH